MRGMKFLSMSEVRVIPGAEHLFRYVPVNQPVTQGQLSLSSLLLFQRSEVTAQLCYTNFIIIIIIIIINELNETTADLLLSVTENTSRKPSPDLIYCSLIALNSSWPAVSNTKTSKIHIISLTYH